MPTYEYVCLKCDREFELVQSISADALTTCPKEMCGKKPWGKGKVKRQIVAGAGLLFKGSGFYITDYRSDNYKAGEKADKPKSETKSTTPESKPKSTGTDSGGAKGKEKSK